MRHSWCTSTNFNSLKKSNKANCELNKQKFSPITDDSKLTDEPGITFTTLLKVRKVANVYLVVNVYLSFMFRIERRCTK